MEAEITDYGYEDVGGDVGVVVRDEPVDLECGRGDMERCRRLVVYGGKSLKDAACELGLKLSLVKGWARDGRWGFERRVVESGKEDAVCEAMESFARSRELPLVDGYYELQEMALNRLKELLGDKDLTAAGVGVVLEVAERGLNLGERVLGRANPDRTRKLLEAGLPRGGGGVDGGKVGGVQVNVLAAALGEGEKLR